MNAFRQGIGRATAPLCIVSFLLATSSGCFWKKPEEPRPMPPPPTFTAPAEGPLPAPLARPTEYRIGASDTIRIWVYNEEELDSQQTVRPDGKISFPLVGDIQAEGATPTELAGQIREVLARYLVDPQVTVTVTEYTSRRVSVLGQVESPGLLELDSDLDLVQVIAQAGGFTDAADLRGAMLVRDGEILPVSFHKLFREGDFSQNVGLQAKDIVLVPDANERRILVLGEVQSPSVISLTRDLRLMEAITLAKGFTFEAHRTNVLLIRGGLTESEVYVLNAQDIWVEGETPQNVDLAAGDIVYVPRSNIANVLDFMVGLKTILQPIILAMTGILLAPAVGDVITTGSTQGVQGTVSIPIPVQ